jgi:hypothetical protein
MNQIDESDLMNQMNENNRKNGRPNDDVERSETSLRDFVL